MTQKIIDPLIPIYVIPFSQIFVHVCRINDERIDKIVIADFSQFNPYLDPLKVIRSSNWQTYAKSSNEGFPLEILSPVPRITRDSRHTSSPSFLLGNTFFSSLRSPREEHDCSIRFHWFTAVVRDGVEGITRKPASVATSQRS